MFITNQYGPVRLIRRSREKVTDQEIIAVVKEPGPLC
jgi:hypothetical protein